MNYRVFLIWLLFVVLWNFGVPKALPIFDVLVDSPMTTVDYIVGGGTIISPGLTIIPQIPLLNTPLLGL